MSGADLILANGAVWTVDPERPRAEAVAIGGGKILAVGSSREILAHAAPGCDVVELDGRTVLPGFQDAHCHPPMGGLDRMRCDLEGYGDPDSVLAAIERYSREHPDLPWIRGGAWVMTRFPPEGPAAAQLDAVTGARPAYLTECGNHDAWVNTAALRIAGIDRTTPDPPGGRIQRDASGEPTGMLHESAAALVERLAPQAMPEDTKQAILIAQQEFLSFGITAWQDASVGEPQWGDSLEPYHDLAEDGRLLMRTIGDLWWWAERGEEQVEEFVRQRERSTGRFQATTVKMMQDGIVETHTASMLEPYSDSETGDCGIGYFEPEQLKRHVTMLDAVGFQVHIHAIGDKAVRDSLDAYEAALAANGPNDHRHHIAHCTVVQPEDRPRFAQLGVVANCNPLWASYGEGEEDLTFAPLGPERHRMEYAFGSLARAGARLAFGSDWNVTTQNPLPQIEVAVHRILPESRDMPPFYAEEALTLEASIEAFTMGSAFVNHLDDVTGSITPGKLADLCVLDRDLLDRGAGQIADACNVLTLINGRPAFSNGSLGL